MLIFYTENLRRKVALWCFFMNEMSEKNHNSTFQIKISVNYIIFSDEMDKWPRYDT